MVSTQNFQNTSISTSLRKPIGLEAGLWGTNGSVASMPGSRVLVQCLSQMAICAVLVSHHSRSCWPWSQHWFRLGFWDRRLAIWVSCCPYQSTSCHWAMCTPCSCQHTCTPSDIYSVAHHCTWHSLISSSPQTLLTQAYAKKSHCPWSTRLFWHFLASCHCCSTRSVGRWITMVMAHQSHPWSISWSWPEARIPCQIWYGADQQWCLDHKFIDIRWEVIVTISPLQNSYGGCRHTSSTSPCHFHTTLSVWDVF
jgi:hypothetical protein